MAKNRNIKVETQIE